MRAAAKKKRAERLSSLQKDALEICRRDLWIDRSVFKKIWRLDVVAPRDGRDERRQYIFWKQTGRFVRGRGRKATAYTWAQRGSAVRSFRGLVKKGLVDVRRDWHVKMQWWQMFGYRRGVRPPVCYYVLARKGLALLDPSDGAWESYAARLRAWEKQEMACWKKRTADLGEMLKS